MRTSEQWSIEARKKLDAGDYSGAIADYDEALRLDPKDATAYNNRGCAKNELGRFAKAIADFDKALRLDPKYVFAYTNRGFARNKLGRYLEAIADYDEVLRLDPKYMPAYDNRGFAKAKLGQFAEAFSDFDEARCLDPMREEYFIEREVRLIFDCSETLRLDPKKVSAFVNRGAAKNRLGRYFEAIEDFDEALRLDPKYVDAYNNRGIAKESLGQFAQAIADFDEALRLDPKSVLAYTNRGIAKHDLGHYLEAIADYDEVLRLDPKYMPAYENRGFAKAKLGQFAEAFSDFDEARCLDPMREEHFIEREVRLIFDCSETLRLDPKKVSAFVNRGAAKNNLDFCAEAIADYDEALRLDSKSATVYVERGHVKVRLGQHAEAIADYDEALRLDSKSATVYVERGHVKVRLGQHAEAIADYDKALCLNPKDADTYYHCGLSKIEVGRFAESLSDFDKASSLDPTSTCWGDYGDARPYLRCILDCDEILRLDSKNVKAYNSRGLAKNKLGRYLEAIADYDEALRLDPNNVCVYVNRGHAKNSFGQQVEAMADCEEALRLDPKNALAYLIRGVIKYLSLGQSDEAMADLDKALRLDPGGVRAYAYDTLGWFVDLNNQVSGDIDEALMAAEQAKPKSPKPAAQKPKEKKSEELDERLAKLESLVEAAFERGAFSEAVASIAELFVGREAAAEHMLQRSSEDLIAQHERTWIRSVPILNAYYNYFIYVMLSTLSISRIARDPNAKPIVENSIEKGLRVAHDASSSAEQFGREVKKHFNFDLHVPVISDLVNVVSTAYSFSQSMRHKKEAILTVQFFHGSEKPENFIELLARQLTLFQMEYLKTLAGQIPGKKQRIKDFFSRMTRDDVMYKAQEGDEVFRREVREDCILLFRMICNEELPGENTYRDMPRVFRAFMEAKYKEKNIEGADPVYESPVEKYSQEQAAKSKTAAIPAARGASVQAIKVQADVDKLRAMVKATQDDSQKVAQQLAAAQARSGSDVESLRAQLQTVQREASARQADLAAALERLTAEQQARAEDYAARVQVATVEQGVVELRDVVTTARAELAAERASTQVSLCVLQSSLQATSEQLRAQEAAYKQFQEDQERAAAEFAQMQRELAAAQARATASQTDQAQLKTTIEEMSKRMGRMHKVMSQHLPDADPQLEGTVQLTAFDSPEMRRRVTQVNIDYRRLDAQMAEFRDHLLEIKEQQEALRVEQSAATAGLFAERHRRENTVCKKITSFCVIS